MLCPESFPTQTIFRHQLNPQRVASLRSFLCAASPRRSCVSPSHPLSFDSQESSTDCVLKSNSTRLASGHTRGSDVNVDVSTCSECHFCGDRCLLRSCLFRDSLSSPPPQKVSLCATNHDYGAEQGANNRCGPNQACIVAAISLRGSQDQPAARRKHTLLSAGIETSR
jgi:NAD-dependent dihydropyrimidine dehydrogenase PreA subunit